MVKWSGNIGKVIFNKVRCEVSSQSHKDEVVQQKSNRYRNDRTERCDHNISVIFQKKMLFIVGMLQLKHYLYMIS